VGRYQGIVSALCWTVEACGFFYPDFQECEPPPEGGSERGAYNLGAIYDKGGVGLEKNSSRAIGWYRLSAKWGYAAAQYRLAESLRGQGKEEEALEWYLEASKKGHVSSMLKGGMLLLSKSKKAADGGGGDGSGWEGEGGRLIRQAADSGSGKAMYLLASRENGGIGPWLRKSAESGHVPAMTEWGLALLNGNGSVPVQVHVAAVWLLKAAKGGDAGAQAKIGAMYIEGFPRRIGEQYHEVKDQKEGYRWIHEAAKQGVADAQYAIGLYYLAGQELPHILREERGQKSTHDRYAGFEPKIGKHKAKPRTHKQEMRDQAMLWFRRAAKQGNVEAMWELSQLIISANIHKKVAKLVAVRQEAFGLILGAAEAGMAVAQAEMGHIWREGRWGIVSPNATASAGWFSLAARNGFPSAQLELAYALIGGLGVAKDEVKACGWLERASQAGIAEARYELGARHIGIAPRTVRSVDKNIAIGAENSKGEGGSSPGIRWDAGLGEKLLASAASGGHKEAMLMLGRWCLGVGTKRRREEGLGWLRKAAESGLGEAQKEYGEGLLEDANGKDKAVVEEGVLFLKEAVKNGVAGAAESMKKWTKTLGMQPKAPGGSEATFGSAHLMSDHVLHTEVGRLKIKVRSDQECGWFWAQGLRV
jgi:TPR repeat protein